MRAFALALAATAIVASAPALAQAPSAALKEAVSGPHRTEANRARDQYRHPAETLAFFGVKPTDTVVEIWPGGGWYTEILASYLGKGGGTLIVGAPTAKGLEGTQKRLAARPELFGKVQAVNFPALLGGTGVAPGTADVVLTFRNAHNWGGGYMHPEKKDYAADAFREAYAMLKPGGVLGVVDHRLPESADSAREKTSGYIKVSTVRRLAEQAGFRYVGSSEINANKKDTADWPKGVWTLPPNYAEGETDRAKYQAIGESDRFTLKFVKPKG
jgi:predicted methyltransferase